MHTDIQAVLADHPGLLHRARFVRMRFDIRSPSASLRVEVDGPRVRAELVDAASTPEPPDFSLEAGDGAWEEFSRPLPQPGFHDLLALLGEGHARFEGDGLRFYTHLFLVKGIVAAVFRKEGAVW